MKNIVFLFVITTTVCKAQQQLGLPLQGGHFPSENAIAKDPDIKDIYLYPGLNHQVRASEAGVVLTTASVDSSNFLIEIRGVYEIAYMNLRRIFVKRGDRIKLGQTIGELRFAQGAPDAEALIIRIEKNGKYYVDPTIFRRVQSSGQKSTTKDTSLGGVVLDSSYFKHKAESPLQFFISIHADSIDNMKAGGYIPLFLTDAQFDYRFSAVGRGVDNPLPLRKMIFDKVKNCAALRRIMDDSSGIYRKKPVIEHDIHVDYSDLSFSDLAARRYSQLHCSINQEVIGARDSLLNLLKDSSQIVLSFETGFNYSSVAIRNKTKEVLF